MSNPELLTEREAADLIGVSKFTLESWRYAHRGPRYFNLGDRNGTLRYSRADLDAWLASRIVDPARRRETVGA
jgi:predicted DNA-binding transcriptional regulator AlpA